MILRHFLSNFRFSRCKTRSSFAQTRSGEPGLPCNWSFINSIGVGSIGAHAAPISRSACWRRWPPTVSRFLTIVVVMAGPPDRYLVIDGFQRIQALEQLGRDTAEAVVWPSSELYKPCYWSMPCARLGG